VTQENIDLVHKMLLHDRQVTVKFIAEGCGFAVDSVE
jgi:hypothetical protein